MHPLHPPWLIRPDRLQQTRHPSAEIAAAVQSCQGDVGHYSHSLRVVGKKLCQKVVREYALGLARVRKVEELEEEVPEEEPKKKTGKRKAEEQPEEVIDEDDFENW